MKLSKEFVAGLMFLVLGLVALAMGTQYRLGTARAMGPGYFPILLSSAITLIGLVIAGRALLNPAAYEAMGRIHLRPLAIITAAVLAFGLLIDRLGLIVAVTALGLVSRLAIPGKGVIDFVLLLVVLNVIALVIFVLGLGLPLKLGPW